MNQERFNELLAKYLVKSLAPAEQRELDDCVSSDPNAKEQLLASRQIWDKSGALSLFHKFEGCKNTDFGKVMARTCNKKVIGEGTVRIGMRRWMAAASVLLVLALTGWYLHQNVAGFGKWESVVAANPNTVFTLPDNSTVTLNQDSRIEYLTNMNNAPRVVRLNGEAFFDVKKSDSHSFVVNTENANVVVLGTAFNVRTVKHNQFTEVFVQRGKVSLSDNHQRVVLEANEIGRLDSGQLSKVVAVNQNALFWKDHQLDFNDNTLQEVLDVLVDKFPEIQTVDVRNIDSNTRITTRFQNASLQDILAELQVHVDVELKLENGVLLVK
jgi:transmembrane sensor